MMHRQWPSKFCFSFLNWFIGVVLEPGSPAWFAAASAKTKVVAKNISRIALVSEEATRSLAKQ